MILPASSDPYSAQQMIGCDTSYVCVYMYMCIYLLGFRV